MLQADPDQTGITAKDFLLYCFYGGSAHAGLKNWPKAREFFLHVRDSLRTNLTLGLG